MELRFLSPRQKLDAKRIHIRFKLPRIETIIYLNNPVGRKPATLCFNSCLDHKEQKDAEVLYHLAITPLEDVRIWLNGIEMKIVGSQVKEKMRWNDVEV